MQLLSPRHRPVSTAGFKGSRCGRTSTGNADPPAAASEAPSSPGPQRQHCSGPAPASPPPPHPPAATGKPGPAAARPDGLRAPPTLRRRARPPPCSRGQGRCRRPGEALRPPSATRGPARRRPPLTGPAPSPVRDDLPQQRQRLPRRVLGPRPLPAAPQPRHEGLDLLRQLRAALGGARHGGSAPGPTGLHSRWQRFRFRRPASPLAEAAKVLPPPRGRCSQ